MRTDTRGLLCASPCVVSVASIWEVAIKHRLGKLEVPPAFFRDQSLAAGAALLPRLEGHVVETAFLPLLEHDPFDRLLIAQARVEGLMTVSEDGQWPGYDFHCIASDRWAAPEINGGKVLLDRRSKAFGVAYQP
jgi:PIN domain nuclease of toxin-antitoxin system